MGYWVSSVVVSQFSGLLIGLLLGGLGAYTSEMITRKLNTIKL